MNKSNEELISELMIIEKAVYHLQNKLYKLEFDARKVVEDYIKTNVPNHISPTLKYNYNISFEWSEDGIVVHWEYSSSAWTNMNDDHENSNFRLKYEDVFGTTYKFPYICVDGPEEIKFILNTIYQSDTQKNVK